MKMTIATLLWVILVIGNYDISLANTSERMVVRKMRMTDLESSATGYAYNQQQGRPLSFVQYTNHGAGRYYNAPAPVHYVMSIRAPVAQPQTVLRYEPALAYANPQIPLDVANSQYANGNTGHYAGTQLSSLATNPVPARAPYFVDRKISNTPRIAKQTYKDDKKYGQLNDAVNRENDYAVEESNYGESNIGVKNIHNGDIEDSKYESGGESKHASEEFSAHGDKGAKGYKNHEEFDKAERTDYGNEKETGYYANKGGSEKGHHDEAGSYGQHHENEHEERDNSFGKGSYHKKGEKTKGYHNVYHKDEYKKDTEFYDDEHKDGYFENYSSGHKHLESKEGGFKKGDSHNSEFDDQSSGKKGSFAKGREQNHEQGHKGEKGQDVHYRNHEDYQTKEGSRKGNKHGFASKRDRY